MFPKAARMRIKIPTLLHTDAAMARRGRDVSSIEEGSGLHTEDLLKNKFQCLLPFFYEGAVVWGQLGFFCCRKGGRICTEVVL